MNYQNYYCEKRDLKIDKKTITSNYKQLYELPQTCDTRFESRKIGLNVFVSGI
jgi:hypothetical protein